MSRRRWKEKLEPAEAADADLRKATFRDMANDFLWDLKHGIITDRPGSIARMMEQAFKAGVLAARSDPTFDSKDRLKRSLTDMDVPSLARDALKWFRYALGGGFGIHDFYKPVETLDLGKTEPFRAAGLVVFMRPKIAGLPPTLTKDEWFLWNGHSKQTFSNKVIGPLGKAGLLNIVGPDEVGRRLAVVNEWGFELLVTGRTSFPEDREPGTSGTYAVYQKLMHGTPNPVDAAIEAMKTDGRDE